MHNTPANVDIDTGDEWPPPVVYYIITGWDIPQQIFHFFVVFWASRRGWVVKTRICLIWGWARKCYMTSDSWSAAARVLFSLMGLLCQPVDNMGGWCPLRRLICLANALSGETSFKWSLVSSNNNNNNIIMSIWQQRLIIVKCTQIGELYISNGL